MEEQAKYELAKAQATSALVTASQSLFFDVNKFEHAQRVARMLATSTLVPEHFKNNLGNCIIALNYAERIQADPFMVMQNMYVVHGRPGLEAKLVIALVNQCGRFEPLEFDETATSCTAYAKEIKSEKTLRGPAVTMDMVKAEGWLSKNGSKWQTMPQIMFRYRSAVFFARTYCPEVLLGMKTIDEIEDMTIDLKKESNGSYGAKPKIPEVTNEDVKAEVEEKLNALKESGQTLPQQEVEQPTTQELKCDICGLPCASERGLKKHKTQSHPPVKGPEPKQEFTEPEHNTPPIVDSGEREPEEVSDIDQLRKDIERYKEVLKPGSWEAISSYFRGWNTDKATTDLLKAMKERCKTALDKQNAG